MSVIVNEENQNMYGVEYFEDCTINQDISVPYDIPINNITNTQQLQYNSCYSQPFPEVDGGNPYIQASNNNNTYTNLTVSNDLLQNNINNCGYQNYNQESGGCQQNYYPSYYSQEHNSNNSNNLGDLSVTYYTNDGFNNKLQEGFFMSSESTSPQLIDNSINSHCDYSWHNSQMEDTSSYISPSSNNTAQYQTSNKGCYSDKNNESTEVFYDYFYSPELCEIIEFFRSNKGCIFRNNTPSNETFISTNNAIPTTNQLVEVNKTENTLQYQGGEGDEKMTSPNSYSSKDPYSPSEIYNSNVSKKLQNEMIVENIEVFANNFKNLRISYGFTQGDVGRHIGLRFGSEFSQTTISRFEALNLSCKNMLKLKPKLEEWLLSTQKLFQQGYTSYEINQHNLHNKFPKPSLAEQEAREISEIKKVRKLYSKEKSKKRRKRTNLEMEQRNILYRKYLEDKRPNEENLRKMADELNLNFEVVKIWFCNRRQKDRKNMVKKNKE
uniref:POU domain protein n=1 Tax=Strongyloides stercoralis TaxID=6248 RepID=A0A0K0ET59_STRER